MNTDILKTKEFENVVDLFISYKLNADEMDAGEPISLYYSAEATKPEHKFISRYCEDPIIKSPNCRYDKILTEMVPDEADPLYDRIWYRNDFYKRNMEVIRRAVQSQEHCITDLNKYAFEVHANKVLNAREWNGSLWDLYSAMEEVNNNEIRKIIDSLIYEETDGYYSYMIPELMDKYDDPCLRLNLKFADVIENDPMCYSELRVIKHPEVIADNRWKNLMYVIDDYNAIISEADLDQIYISADTLNRLKKEIDHVYMVEAEEVPDLEDMLVAADRAANESGIKKRKSELER